MILIINQHKGLIKELTNYLDSAVNSITCKKIYEVIVVDQATTEDEEIILNKYNSPNRVIWYNHKNLGLSPSREIAIRVAEDKFKDFKFSHVIFGCTNCKYNQEVGDNVYRKLVDIGSRYAVTLIPCVIKNDFVNRDDLNFRYDSVSFNNYINTPNRPDYTLMIKYEYGKYVISIAGEKYYPEEIILANIFTSFKSKSMGIYHNAFQISWYNKDGLSLNFDRQFQLDNSKGFLKRAIIFLGLYESNQIQLTSDTLKWFIYDYITFGGSPTELFNPILKELYWYGLRHWIETPSKNHKLKFIEDV